MILDILFEDGSSPIQYQHVKRTDFVKHHEAGKGMLVIQFYDTLYPEMSIPLYRIKHIAVTNS